MTDTTVYINQLPYRWTADELSEHLAPAGTIASVDMKKFSDGVPRGWALVTFENAADAENAVRTFNGTSIEGRTIIVRVDHGVSPNRATRPAGGRGGFSGGRGAPSGGRGRNFPRVRSTDPTRAVYVSNLAWGVTWRELHKHFQTAGAVIRADVMYGRDGRSKGCGIVEFATVEDAQKAVSELSGTHLLDRPILVREDREETGVEAVE